jgi:hypothetical protein
MFISFNAIIDSEEKSAVSLDTFRPTKKKEFEQYAEAVLEKFATFPVTCFILTFSLPDTAVLTRTNVETIFIRWLPRYALPWTG